MGLVGLQGCVVTLVKVRVVEELRHFPIKRLSKSKTVRKPLSLVRCVL